MNTAFNVSLPEKLTHYINQRVAEEHFSNVSDYFCALIFAEQKQREEQKLEQLLLDGLTSPVVMTANSKEWDDFWEKLLINSQAA